MKILLDDFRTTAPDGTVPDIIVKNYDAAMELWVCSDIDWTELYIDHDLGDAKERTGYDFLCELEKAAHSGEDVPHKIVIVSDNGDARRRMQQAIDSIYKLQRENGMLPPDAPHFLERLK